jgi:hypothetical protein
MQTMHKIMYDARWTAYHSVWGVALVRLRSTVRSCPAAPDEASEIIAISEMSAKIGQSVLHA